MATATLQDLFASVQGYALSSQGKERIGRDGDPALTYGECTCDAVDVILSMVSPVPGEVFYDLGSGTGKMVVYAASLAPLSRSVGIELLPELHVASEEVAQRYREQIQPTFSDPRRDTAIEFLCEDIFNADLGDADIVVSHCCTCFDDELMGKLQCLLEKCKSGTRVVTITRTLSSPAFRPIGTTSCEMGWGRATVHAYVKN